MKLSKRQWLTLAAMAGTFSAVCIGRLAYMAWNNYLLARTDYVDASHQSAAEPSPSVGREEATPDDVDKLSPRERMRRIVEDVRKRAAAAQSEMGSIRRRRSANFWQREYGWDEIGPWLFAGLLFAGLSVFLTLTAKEQVPPRIGPRAG